MANNSRTQQRSGASSGRFGRAPSTAKTTASGRSLRAGSGEAGPKGRFGLGSSLGPSGYGRTSPGRSATTTTAAPRRGRPGGRSKAPQQSGMSKALTALTGGKAAKKTASRSAKPAGFALLAGAAGLALKNRDKLMGLAGRGGHSEPSEALTTSTTTTVGTPGIQEDNRSAPSPMGTTEGGFATPPDMVIDPPPNQSHG